MKVKDCLRINKDLSEDEVNGLEEIQKMLEMRFLGDERDFYITDTLDILHKGLAVDNTDFIAGIFFKFHASVVKLGPHKKQVYSNLEALGHLQAGSREEQVHLVTIYRSIVSDLFDPYITLFVACLQYIEGKFVNFHQANLGISERSKTEYVMKRLKGSKLFSGYDPLVRNAISHSGSDGVKYEQEHILFKNIKRGAPPLITWVKWTTEELMENIFAIVNFVNGIDCAVNIFGIDIANLLFANQELERLFLWEIMDKPHRMSISKTQDELFSKISSSDLEEEEKIDGLTSIFFLECAKREMPVMAMKFALEKQTVKILLPGKEIDESNTNQMLSRLIALARYGIIAEPVFRAFVNNYVVAEIDDQQKDGLKLICEAADLKKYGDEEVGLVDLIHDSGCFLGKDRIQVQVDWKAFADHENMSLEKEFPRKKRS